MARSIAEIKGEIAREWMRNESVAAHYGFTPGTAFSSRFGAASIENMLMYVFSVAAWTLERLMDLHRDEVGVALEAMKPHGTRWYCMKVLGFMADKPLAEDSDDYDTAGMTDEEVSAAHVVRHAVATESRDAGLLTIKVAGEMDGERGPLSAAHEAQLRAYIGEVKDAGVRVALVNMEGDVFSCGVDVYYDPMMDAQGVKSRCVEAIKAYIENLPFNGEYTNMALVDALQCVEGVRIAELKWSRKVSSDGTTPMLIDARAVPDAGYFKAGSLEVNMVAYA